MAVIKPFKALRPAAQFAKGVASRPYDVLNTAEAKKEAQGYPYSFLHITKSEIDLPEKTDIHSAEVYEKAKDNITSFIKRNILFLESKECYYIYRLIMNGKSQIGITAVSSIADYENNIIKKHELTRPEKEEDRINHILATGAQTGNVFLAYKNTASIDALVEKWITDKNPVYDFVADDKIQHTVWNINDDKIIASITQLFKDEVPVTYIADGHHRAASASKVKERLNDKSTPEANYFLTTLFPANQLQILDYNRIVKTLNNLSADDFLKSLQEDFTVEEKGLKAYKPKAAGRFGLYLNKKWYKLKAKEHTEANDAINILDISVLQKYILAKHLNIHDQRTDKNIDFIGGIRGLKELEEKVNNGEAVMAFSMYPVSMDQLFAVADSNEVMPPKSTWFEPKLRDGLLTHLIRNYDD